MKLRRISAEKVDAYPKAVLKMTKTKLDGLYLMLAGCAVFLFMGLALEFTSPKSMTDFKVPYYSARCLLNHCDPYKQSDVLHIYQAEKGERPGEPWQDSLNATRFVYLPTLFLFTVPLAILSFGPAHIIWLAFTLGSVVLASFLSWDLAAEHAPVVSACLIAFMLANSELLVVVGNPAGIAVGLCITAVWCFFKKRYQAAGVWCFAISLLVKPHDVAFVWLYFLLAGGTYRKRALQTFALAVALGLPTTLCFTHFSPHWISELHSTMSSATAHGGPDDPGPASISAQGLAMLVNLQTAISYFRDDPHFYNPAAYLACGALLLVWFAATMRSRLSSSQVKLALAVLAPLSLLPVYHRQYDALLLLLAIPACAMLVSQSGVKGRLALLVTAAAFVVTGDFLWVVLYGYAGNPHASNSLLVKQLSTGAQLLPIPLILLATAIFYLWIYIRCPAEQAPQKNLEA